MRSEGGRPRLGGKAKVRGTKEEGTASAGAAGEQSESQGRRAFHADQTDTIGVEW